MSHGKTGVKSTGSAHAAPPDTQVKPGAVGVTPVFAWNIQAKQRFKINQGGSSSSKTYSILQVALQKAKDKPGLIVTVTAESLPALRAGAMRDFEAIVSQMPFKAWVYKPNLSTHTWRLRNGSIVEFKSFATAEAAKHGKRNILFLNEASNIPYEIAQNLIMRSGSVFIDFNPTFEFWVHEKYLGHPDAQWIFSTWRDNPFVNPEMRDDIESLKESDPELYKVYGLGKRGALKGQVFANVEYCTEFPDYCSDVVYGMDIGFSNSYTTLVKIGRADGKIYGEELLYAKGMIDSDIVQALERLGVSKSAPLIVDNANQMTIEYLRQHGDFNAAGCKKRDVVAELQAMKRHKWVITADSLNWKKEVSNYLYQKDKKTGSILNAPVKAFDHLWDAARYAFLQQEQGSSLPEFL